MTLDEKYRATYIKLGYTLIRKGMWFVKKAFGIKGLRKVSQSYIRNFLSTKGFEKLNFADGSYYIPDIKTMKEIIKYDWTEQKDYLVDRYDCDNYAESFRAHTHEIFEINNVALAKHIKITFSDGRKGYHRCCLFLATEDDIMKLYVLETQNDKMKLIENNKPFKLGSWTYSLDTIEF